MTKTLTEQWRDGTLPDGEYYVKDWDGKIDWFVAKNKILWRDNNNPMYASERIEVLAPVPSYTELTLMAGNYRLAKKALRDCYNEMKYWATMNHRCSKIFNHIKAALVEMEEEQ